MKIRNVTIEERNDRYVVRSDGIQIGGSYATRYTAWNAASRIAMNNASESVVRLIFGSESYVIVQVEA